VLTASPLTGFFSLRFKSQEKQAFKNVCLSSAQLFSSLFTVLGFKPSSRREVSIEKTVIHQ